MKSFVTDRRGGSPVIARYCAAALLALCASPLLAGGFSDLLVQPDRGFALVQDRSGALAAKKAHLLALSAAALSQQKATEDRRELERALTEVQSRLEQVLAEKESVEGALQVRDVAVQPEPVEFWVGRPAGPAAFSELGPPRKAVSGGTHSFLESEARTRPILRPAANIPNSARAAVLGGSRLDYYSLRNGYIPRGLIASNYMQPNARFETRHGGNSKRAFFIFPIFRGTSHAPVSA